MSSTTSPTQKGKQRADSHHARSSSVSSDIEDAISTSISPPSPTSLSHISPLPQAHHSSIPPPRLLSQFTRTTQPTSYVSHARAASASHHPGFIPSPSSNGESSSSWLKSQPTTFPDDPFPDLDPSTGLPIDAPPPTRLETQGPSLKLQRTITDLLKTPTKEEKSYFPSLSGLNLSLPSLKAGGEPRRTASNSSRSFSTTTQADDWGSWATGWWGGNKGKVDQMMSQEDQADTVEEEKANLKRKYRSPKHPVVFCHGLLGFDYLGPASLPTLQISHWRGIREVLESNGTDVLICRVPATASIKDRATILDELISEKYPGQQVNLIGHSMGGLDCRYLISQIDPKKFTPISLTTISTPHRGSPFADYVIDSVIGRERLPSVLSLMESFRLPHSGDGSAFNALGTKAMKEFNSVVVDKEDVKYYSWGATVDPGLLDTFRWPHSVILKKEGPNDGLVSVQSARWGEYRGTLVGVNHLDLVGWVNHVRYAISGWMGNAIVFKPATFYLEVADYLAEQGF
ncbi:triacylglycerol lipase, partial [Tremellales sp. Uapishka_1]